MFAVKSTYSIKTPDGNDIHFYVAGNGVYFNRKDIADSIYGSLFGIVILSSFENYDEDFVSFIECRNLFLEQPQRFMNRDFWRDIFNQDYSKVIAEVRDAQNFLKDFAYINLPRDWERINVDFILNDLHTRASDWIETCYKSLQILATNFEQHQLARRVYDEAWKILKECEKAETADKRPTVHDTLAKFTDDDLIQAILDVHQRKFDKEHAKRQAEFDNQHIYLENELRRILK